MAKSDEQVIEESNQAVNMTRKELEEWLETEESQSVGQSDGGGESKGRESGRKTVEILGKNKSDYTDEDIDHMRRVVSYVHRHQAQKPNGDVENSSWRYSLLNWGHDPLNSEALIFCPPTCVGEVSLFFTLPRVLPCGVFHSTVSPCLNSCANSGSSHRSLSRCYPGGREVKRSRLLNAERRNEIFGDTRTSRRRGGLPCRRIGFDGRWF